MIDGCSPLRFLWAIVVPLSVAGADHPGAAQLPVGLERLPVAPDRHPQRGDAPHPARAAGVLDRVRLALRRADGGVHVVILPTVIALLAWPSATSWRGSRAPASRDRQQSGSITWRTSGDRCVGEERSSRWQSHVAASSDPPGAGGAGAAVLAACRPGPGQSAPARAPRRSSSASRSASPSGTPRPASTRRRWTSMVRQVQRHQRQEHHPQERVPGRLHPGLPEDHGLHSGRPARRTWPWPTRAWWPST